MEKILDEFKDGKRHIKLKYTDAEKQHLAKLKEKREKLKNRIK